MRKIKKLVCMTLTVALLGGVSQNLTVSAADAKVQMELKEGKTYKYNLDKSGKKEEIKYVRTYKDNKEFDEDNVLDEVVTIYINDKKAYRYVNEEAYKSWPKVKVWLFDTNTKDKQMEIFLQDKETGDLYYLLYQDGKLKKQQNLLDVVKGKYTKLMSTYSEGMIAKSSKKLFKMDGKGKLTVDIRQCVGDAGWVQFTDSLTLKNSKFVMSSSKTMKIVPKACGTEYAKVVMENKGAIYKDTACKNTVCSLKKGDKITLYQVTLLKDGSLALKAKDSKGHCGYVKVTDLPECGLLFFV